jgi:poly-gamma-glutamate capsule biosynthesis protein CapA/YwtB (metallophosphatase superfamily)
MQIAFVGDVMLGRLVAQELRRRPPEYPWGDTLPLLRRADALVGNLEFVIADDGVPWPGKAFHFRADRRAVASLEAAGFALVSVANNHVLDFGKDAALTSLETLAQRGIRFAGAGENADAARRPAVIRRDDLTIAMLAFTDNEPDWEAGPTSLGVHHVPVDLTDPRAVALLDAVARERDVVDLLIVSAHWGGNWGIDVPRRHRAFGRALVDAGADVVFGHSPHIVRGVEVYRDRPILYGAGDFVDDYAVDPVERNDRSFVFVLRVEEGVPTELRLHPTEILDFHARLADRHAAEIADDLARRCADLGTRAGWDDDEGCLVIRVAPMQHR